MKLQDIVFIVVFLHVLFIENPRISIWFGLICLILAIPLFSFWIFYTAEHLIWYAAAFFLLASIRYLFNRKK